jgi:hypothetical protein
MTVYEFGPDFSEQLSLQFLVSMFVVISFVVDCIFYSSASAASILFFRKKYRIPWWTDYPGIRWRPQFVILIN